MKTYSHIDTVLFYRFLDIQGTDIPEEVESALNNQDASKSILDEAFGKQFSASRNTMLHESYHYWQGLMLPYLQRRAILGHRNVLLAFRELSRHSSNYTDWGCILSGFSSIHEKSYLYGRPGGEGFRFASSRLTQRGHELAFSPIDLLENAASIAEFQFECSGIEAFDPDEYRKWCIWNPAYTSVQKYVESCLQDKTLAYRITLPLINVSFQTTQPTRAFALLLQLLFDCVDGEPELRSNMANANPYTYRQFLEKLLSYIEMEESDDADAEFHDPKFHKISSNAWAGAHFGEIAPGLPLDHPFLATDSKAWLSAINEGLSEIKALLDHPGILRAEAIDLAASKFSPPLTLARFKFSNGQSRALLWGTLEKISPAYTNGFSPVDLLTMYSMVKRAANINFDRRARLCSHEKCPNYKGAFCANYPGVPENFEKCEFPEIAHSLVKVFIAD